MKSRCISLLVLLIFGVSLAAAAGCGGGYTIESGKLVVGIEVDPPWLIEKGGAYEGFGIDVLNRVADELELTFDYGSATSRETRAADLDAKKFDVCGAPAGITPVNEKVVDITIPIATTSRSIIVLASSSVQDASALKGRSLGALENTPDVEDAGEVSENVKVIADEDGLFASLDNGSVDAIVITTAESAYRNKVGEKYRTVGKLGGKLEWGFAVRKGNTGLLDKLNGALEKMKSDGSLKQIQEKWLPEP